MININKVVEELSRKRQELDNLTTTKGSTRLKGQINFLTTVAHYLRSFPSEEFIHSEMGRIKNRILLFNDQYEKWIPNRLFKDEKEKFSEYLKEMGVPKLKLQLRALRYIANE